MHLKGWFYAFYIAIIIPCITSCSALGLFPSMPDDLKFVSIRKVNLEELPEAPKADLKRFDPENRTLLEISFSTASDLNEIADTYDNVTNHICGCAEWRNHSCRPFMAAGLDVYRNGVSVTDEPVKHQVDIPIDRTNIYQIYGEISQEPSKGTLPPYATPPFIFNLYQNPQAICFQVGGWRILTGDSDSNVVAVPKGFVAAVLLNYP
jgi:hypothetical protein